jgi:TIR domain
LAKIIISYRRSDSDVFAGRVRDRIAGDFGENSVFIDVDNIPFGKDFRIHIQEALAEANAVLVVVGPRWLGIGKGGHSRITNDTDPVRIEVEAALSNGIPIIPILVGQTKMPAPEQLPESLRNFAFINAAPVDTGRDFHRDLNRVIATINTILDRPLDGLEAVQKSQETEVGGRADEAQKKATEPQAQPSKRALVISSLIGATIVAAVGAWFVVARLEPAEQMLAAPLKSNAPAPAAPAPAAPAPARSPSPIIPTSPEVAATQPAVAPLNNEAVDPGADVVRAFYTALGHGDGATAAKFVVPEHQTGHFDPQGMTRFFSSLSKPLQLISVVPYGQNEYQATYTYVATTKVCNNSVVVALTKRNGQYLIQNIDSRGGC